MDRPRPPLAAALALAGLLASSATGCAGVRGPPGAGATADAVDRPDLSAAAAGATLTRFAQALEGGRWSEAWALLSPRWRAATTPARLAADWRGAGPLAPEAAARVVALLEGGAALDAAPGEGGGTLRLRVGPGRAARVVAEAGRWRVDALE